MHVTVSHYYNPQPRVYEVFNVGQEISQLRELWTWMRDDSQWRSAEGARKAWTSSPPRGSWLVHIPQPTTCTEQPLNHDAYSNQAKAQSSICPSTYYAQSFPRCKGRLTDLFMTENCIKRLKALIAAFLPPVDAQNMQLWRCFVAVEAMSQWEYASLNISAINKAIT